MNGRPTVTSVFRRGCRAVFLSVAFSSSLEETVANKRQRRMKEERVFIVEGIVMSNAGCHAGDEHEVEMTRKVDDLTMLAPD